jgi:hypothetical protein
LRRSVGGRPKSAESLALTTQLRVKSDRPGQTIPQTAQVVVQPVYITSFCMELTALSVDTQTPECLAQLL